MESIIDYVKARDPHEREFHQAVSEVMDSIKPVMEQNPEYRKKRILERLVEPERVIIYSAFRGWTTRASSELTEDSACK